VVVKTHQEIDGERAHRGTLQSAGDDTCVIEIEGNRRVIPLNLIASARTVFRWEPAAKPGAKAR
jgi:ribosome maturation factor RimP